MNRWLESWTGLRLEDPFVLLLVLLVPLAMVVRLRRGSAALFFAPPLEGLPVTWRARLRVVPPLLHGLGLVLLVFAAARPVHRSPLPLEARGIDILVLLDVSSSMSATDMDPARTRLQVAKDEARRLVEGRPHDRVGLVRFARYPDVVCPPTLDHAALAAFLDDVGPVEENGPEDRTGIGAALARAAQMFAGARDGASRVVLLLTDGEENVATADKPGEIGPLPAAQLLRSFGVRVYSIVIGVGAPGPRGAWLPLDLDQVRQVAERTGGVLLEARDAAALAGVVETIDALEKVAFAAPRYELEERFLPFVLLGLLLGLVGAALRRSVWESWP